MHRFIFKVFSKTLAIVHAVVFLVLISSIIIEPQGTLAVMGILLGYVLFVGLSSTVIRMAQNLERIAAALERTGGRSTTGAGVDSGGYAGSQGRREPPLTAKPY